MTLLKLEPQVSLTCQMKYIIPIIQDCCEDLSELCFKCLDKVDAQLFTKCMHKPINKNGTTNVMFIS